METRSRARKRSEAKSAIQRTELNQADVIATMRGTLSSLYSTLGLTEEQVVRGSQYHNMAVAAFVTLGYFMNPEASFLEYGADVAIHVLSALVCENVGRVIPKAGIAANAYRLFNIGYHAVNGDSTIPAVLNALDAVNHVGTIAAETTALGMSMTRF